VEAEVAAFQELMAGGGEGEEAGPGSSGKKKDKAKKHKTVVF